MHEREMTRQQRLSYEKVLYCYTTALEKGDLDGIIPILNAAENDPLLEQMIMETHQAYQQQEQTPQQPSHLYNHTDNDPIRLKSPSAHKLYNRISFQVLAAVVLAAMLIGSTIFLFTSHAGSNVSQTNKSVASAPAGIVVTYTSTITSNTPSGFTDSLIAQHTDTGQTIWHYSLGPSATHNIEVGLFLQDHVVYVVHNQQVQALQTSNGKLLWTWKTPVNSDLITSTSYTIPHQFIVENGRLYVSGYLGGKLYVLNDKNGALLWQYDSMQGTIAPLLTVHNNVAYVIRDDYNHNGVKALRGTDGIEIWSSQTMSMPISAISSDNALYVQIMTSKNAPLPFTLFAIDNRNGQHIWSTAMHGSGSGPLMFTHGSVVLFDGDNFCAYNSNNGIQKWCTKNKHDTNIMGNTTNIQSINDTIYGAYEAFTGKSGDSDGYYNTTIQSINPDNGNILWSRHIQTRSDFTSVGDSLIFFTNDTLQSLNLNDGHTRWQNKYNDHNLASIAAGSL